MKPHNKSEEEKFLKEFVGLNNMAESEANLVRKFNGLR